MGTVIDTVLFQRTVAGATGHAATVATGDSFTIRNFPASASAKLIAVFRQDQTATQGFVQLKSPRLANTTTGIKLRALDSPATQLLPPYALQNVYSGDTLVVNISGTATATHHTGGAFQVYYSTLPGAAARLHSWGDISGIVANLFTQTVVLKTGAAGTWKTVLAKNTQDLMEADTTYALLGYEVSVAYMAVGLKAQEMSNLRIVGPGTSTTGFTSDYFVRLNKDTGLPCIPVVNANNRGNINVTACGGKATITGHITLIWAQLASAVS